MKSPLQRFREAKNLSRAELAKLVGVHYVTIWRLEQIGMGSATVDFLGRLSKALDVPPAALLPTAKV